VAVRRRREKRVDDWERCWVREFKGVEKEWRDSSPFVAGAIGFSRLKAPGRKNKEQLWRKQTWVEMGLMDEKGPPTGRMPEKIRAKPLGLRSTEMSWVA